MTILWLTITVVIIFVIVVIHCRLCHQKSHFGTREVADDKLFSESLVHTSEGEDGRCQGDQREGSFKVSGEGTVPNTWMFKLIIWIFKIGVFCTLLTWRNELKRILQISGMFFYPCPVDLGSRNHWSMVIPITSSSETPLLIKKSS